MKTKSILLREVFLSAFVAACLLSCSKSDPKPAASAISVVATVWTTPDWGGVVNNTLTFNIDATSATGVITAVGSSPFGFAVGDKLFTNITANANGTYSCMGKYTYGTNNSSSSTRSATLSLQNNNTQLTADYPAINADFPEIIYVYQKSPQ